MISYRLVNVARSLVWKYPTLYRPIGRIRNKSDVLDLDYDLTLEGYPRSANTFLLRLLELTQPGIRVRCHRHIPPYAIAALHAGLPVLLLIRAPLDCVTSFAILCGTRAMPQLVSFVAYYQALRPYLDQMVIADFSAVTGAPKEVLREFARRSGLSLDLDFDFEEVRERASLRIIEDHTSATGQLNERAVNWPSEARSGQKAALVAELQRPENRRWLEQANALYQEFRARAVPALDPAVP